MSTALTALRNLPIKRKLTLVIMLTCGSVLLLASIALFVFQSITARAEYVRELLALNQVLAHNAAAAAAFNDRDAAVQMLAAVNDRQDIEGACLVEANGQHVTPLDREGEHNAAEELALHHGYETFGADYLFAAPVMLDDARVGTLYLRADFRPTQRNLLNLYAKTWAVVLLVSLVVAFVLANRFQRLVTGPILHLAELVQRVGQEGDYSLRATQAGNDEVGALTAAFNGMLDHIRTRDDALLEARHGLEQRVKERTLELEGIHRELLEASRRGGMAEIASNVLHNVGNVLNSVNVSATLVSDHVKKSRSASLAKVVALLQEHTADLATFFTADPRGRQLPGYLATFSDHLCANQDAANRELELLRSNIEHIKDIVAMQQSYAKVSGVTEVVQISELVEDSLRMNAGALSRHGVELVRDYEEIAPMNVEKHKILQILVNLIRNAKYACDDSNQTAKRITVRIAQEPDHVAISVIDNGVGIPHENLARIFAHGFTTRQSGHGFGLHSGALAAKEMGGSLTAYSEGYGCGATFTLILPSDLPQILSAA